MSKILVVDDDASVRVLLRTILKRDGHDVIECPDGKSTFKAAIDQRPDLVLLDLMLPDYNGLEILSDFKRDRDLERITVIVLTGSSDRENKLSALSLGAVDFISKPFLPEEVLLRVNTQLKLHHLIKSLRIAVDTLQDDVLAAGRIQTALVPRSAPAGLKMEWIYAPSYRVGGDIFDVIKLSEDRFFIYLADMSGHGVNAAMLSVMVHRFIEDYRSNIRDEDFTLKAFMMELDKNFKFDKFDLFFTILALVIDSQNKRFSLSNAGHPAPLFQKNGECVILETKRESLIGIDMIEGEVSETVFNSGDRLILYTDGLTEALDQNGEMFGTTRLIEVLENSSSDNLSKTTDKLRTRLKNFKSDERFEDDVSVLLIEF